MAETTTETTQETKAAPAEKAKRASRKPARKAAKSSKGRKSGKGRKVAKTAKKARAPKAEAQPCVCGCGKRTLSAKRLFLQGHDAKLHSLFLEIGRGNEKRSAFPKDERALQYVLKDAPWGNAENRRAFNAAK
jgi:hypothetical protein